MTRRARPVPPGQSAQPTEALPVITVTPVTHGAVVAVCGALAALRQLDEVI
jgi:hypothetical protein